MNPRTSQVVQLTAAFAATFVGMSAIAMLLGASLGFRPQGRVDLWAFGLLIVTALTSLLVLGGAMLGVRRSAATARAAWRAGVLVAVPTVIGFEIVEFWSTFSGPAPWIVFVAIAAWCIGGPLYFMRANNALVSDAYGPAPRASHGAPQRERYVASAWR